MFDQDVAIAFLLILTWTFTALTVSGMSFVQKPFYRGFARILTLLALGIVTLLLLLKAAWIILSWQQYGTWLAVANLSIAAPLVIIQAGMLFLAIRLMFRLQTGAKQNVWWLSSNAIGLTTICRAGVVGSALLLYLAFNVPVENYLLAALAYLAVFVAAVTVLYLLQRRWLERIARSAVPRPRMGWHLLRSLGVLASILLVMTGYSAVALVQSRLPARYNMMDLAMQDRSAHSHDHSKKMVSVADLTEKDLDGPIKRVSLVAKRHEMTLSSGQKVDTWSFNGQSPGPEIRATQGDVLEVTVKNEISDTPVSIHWHGLNVPNAEDGVPGVTQNAILPGQTYTYRFRLTQTGSFWYHSHQQSSQQVLKGLFGALTVLPKDADLTEHEEVLMYHAWRTTEPGPTISAFNSNDSVQKRVIKSGTPMHLRLSNTTNEPQMFVLTGAPFKISSLDGNDINKPTALDNARFLLPAGGRVDLTYPQPDGSVYLGPEGPSKRAAYGFVSSPDGTGQRPGSIPDGPVWERRTYGSPDKTGLPAETVFDRTYELIVDRSLGFYDGQPKVSFPVNGKLFPYTPMLMVKEGEVIKTTFYNRSPVDHPMHLHGHHMLVLSKNGKPVTGSPWWTDTLNVAPGEWYETAFLADNPGIWMDHCHNLDHAAAGMMWHVMYEGIASPYESGRDTPNVSE